MGALAPGGGPWICIAPASTELAGLGVGRTLLMFVSPVGSLSVRFAGAAILPNSVGNCSRYNTTVIRYEHKINQLKPEWSFKASKPGPR